MYLKNFYFIFSVSFSIPLVALYVLWCCWLLVSVWLNFLQTWSWFIESSYFSPLLLVFLFFIVPLLFGLYYHSVYLQCFFLFFSRTTLLCGFSALSISPSAVIFSRFNSFWSLQNYAALSLRTRLLIDLWLETILNSSFIRFQNHLFFPVFLFLISSFCLSIWRFQLVYHHYSMFLILNLHLFG